jgi:MipA family protein
MAIDLRVAPKFFAMLITGASLLVPGRAVAEQFPLWEAGVGASVLRFSDYRGSDEFRSYLFPLPYFVYRGERVKVDRESIRGQFFKTDRVELDVSINGTVPLKSRDNAARQGMPDIDATLEIGPSLNTNLWRSDDRRINLILKLPIRGVIASDFRHFENVGWVSHPQISWDVKNFNNTGWHLGMLVGPTYQSAGYNRYLYGVGPEFATAKRPAYEAKAGYGGANIIGGISKRFGRTWFAGFAKYDRLSGAAFEDSPLVKKRSYATFGIAVTYIFTESKKLVESDD